MTDSTVNEHLKEELRKEKLSLEHSHMEAFQDDRIYRRHRKRINFLLGVRQRHGRDMNLSFEEVDGGFINPSRFEKEQSDGTA